MWPYASWNRSNWTPPYWPDASALSLPLHLVHFFMERKGWRKKKSSPQTWNSGRPTLSLLTPPQPCPTCLTSHSSQEEGWEVGVIRLFSEVVPPSWFYFSPCSHFLKHCAATRVWVEEAVQFSKAPTATFRPAALWWRWLLSVRLGHLDSFPVLSFRKCHRGPAMTREELSVTNTGFILGQAK